MTLGLALVGLSQFLTPQAGLIPDDLRLNWLIGANLLGSFGASLYAVNTGPYLMGIAEPSSRRYVFSIQSSCGPCVRSPAAFWGLLARSVRRGLRAAAVRSQPYRLALMVSSACFVLAVLAMSQARNGDSAPDSMAATEAVPAPWGFIVLMALVIALQVASEGAIRTSSTSIWTKPGSATAKIGVFASFGNLAAGRRRSSLHSW